MRRGAAAFLAAALLGVVAGCGEDHLCDICDLSARVVGTVRAGGRAVPNALVRLTPLYGAQPVIPGAQDTVRVTTDGAGRFDATVVGVSILGPDAIEVRIDPLPAEGLASLVDTIPASFAPPWDDPPVLRRDFVLLQLR